MTVIDVVVVLAIVLALSGAGGRRHHGPSMPDENPFPPPPAPRAGR